MQTTDTNARLLRLYYLQQMGIAAWMPRMTLPGALADEDFAAAAEPVEPVPAVAIASKPTLVIDVEPVSKPALATGIESTNEQASHTRPAIVVEPPAAQRTIAAASPSSAERLASAASPARSADDTTVRVQEEQGVPAFQLLFAVVSADLAIAIQIPSAMKPALREGDTRLLANVLRWLGLAWPSQVVPLQFRWPLPGLAATGAEQAGKGLRAFLHQAAIEQPFRRLLVFGGDPAHALRAGGSDSANAFEVWCTHSLAELLALPSLKCETWRTLLPLKAQL